MILWTNIGYFPKRNNQTVFIKDMFTVRQELEISKQIRVILICKGLMTRA